MESKPLLDYSKSPESLISSVSERLEDAHPYHVTNEIIVAQIMEMMAEKTKMYGGNKDLGNIFEQASRAYYEGVGRKTNRVPEILKRLAKDENDIAARKELLDTFIDIFGYSVIALNDLKKYLGDTNAD